jgi:hypothetical protein
VRDAHITAIQQEVARRQSSPFTGKLSARPAGKPGDFLIAKESLRRSLLRHLLPAPINQTTEAPQYAFFKAWRNLSGPMGLQTQNQTLGRDPTASRWSAPRPGKGTRREDRAPSHRPQMSSDRLFLDRVARQHCPSALHRHSQINMCSSQAQAKGDISILPARGHFYFAVTYAAAVLDTLARIGVAGHAFSLRVVTPLPLLGRLPWRNPRRMRSAPIPRRQRGAGSPFRC